MVKRAFFVSSVALAVLFSGCANKSVEPKSEFEKKEQMVKTTNSLPHWIVDPRVEGGIAAVGIAGYSKWGIEVMLPQAEMDARARLAGKIQTVISDLQKRVMRRVKIGEIDDYETSFKKASKELIKKIPLSGANRTDMYQAKDGTLYVLMVIQKREVAKYIDKSKEIYKKHMEEAKMSRERIDEGMKVLDSMVKELDEETSN